jgi:hypothetical protein
MAVFEPPGYFVIPVLRLFPLSDSLLVLSFPSFGINSDGRWPTNDAITGTSRL